MKVTCEVIKDLLPSYTDKICSNDTNELVKEHIKICESCRNILTEMKQPISQLILDEEKVKSKAPFKKIQQKNRIKIGVSTVMAIIATIICIFIIQNVGFINQFFYPQQNVVLNVDVAEWRAVYFESNQYLIFQNIFYNKKITNDANSSGNIKIRISDTEGNIIEDNISIGAGVTANLKRLEYNKNYVVESWMEPGWYKLNFY